MPHGLFGRVLSQPALPAVARTNGVANGTTVDLGIYGNDFNSALFVVNVGTITDGNHVLKLQDSPDGTTWTDVDAAHTQTVAGGPTVTLTSANSNQVASLGYLGGQNEYVRIVATTSGATTGGVFGAVAVLAEGSDDPVLRS